MKRPHVNHLRAVPWALLLQGSIVARQRWTSLSEKERGRLVELLRQSHGRPDRLTERERDDVRRLIGKLELHRAGSDLLPLMRQLRHKGH